MWQQCVNHVIISATVSLLLQNEAVSFHVQTILQQTVLTSISAYNMSIELS